MTTPIDQIDGTEYGKKKAYAQLATLGLMMLGIEMIAPVIMGGGGLEDGGEQITDHLQWVNKVPWMTIGVVMSLVPAFIVGIKKIPRGVRIGKGMGSVRRQNMVRDSGALQSEGPSTTYLYCGSDGEWEERISEITPVSSVPKTARE